MSKRSVIRRIINAIGVLCMVNGGILAGRTYGQLYEFASTGESAFGKTVTDFPPSITLYIGLLFLGCLILELGEWWWRRTQPSNNSSKPTPLRGAA